MKQPLNAKQYVFTGQRVELLSGMLHSPKAITIKIAIMRAFVEFKRILLTRIDLIKQLL